MLKQVLARDGVIITMTKIMKNFEVCVVSVFCNSFCDCFQSFVVFKSLIL